MPRKPKDTTFSALASLASLLPWWLCVAFCLISYFGLHAFAGRAMPVDSNTRVSEVVLHSFVSAAIGLGQYLVPAIFAAGAALSLIGRFKRESLIEAAKSTPSGSAVARMSWSDFELLVGQAFRLRSYAVRETGGGGPDGGVDLHLIKDGELFLVQCKHWRAFKVGVQVVRELYGVMAAEGAAGGFVVTSGVYTEEAKRFAAGRNITLIDGHELQGWFSGSESASAARDRGTQPGSAPFMVTSKDSPAVDGKTTTSKLASKLGVTTKELQVRLLSMGYLELRGDRHFLTDAGKSAGGEWKPGRNGGYMIWPSDMRVEAPR